MEKMSWKKAIEKVLREVGRPMNSADIAKQIIERGYYKSTKSDPDGQVINVNTNLYSNPGWFRKVDEDLWELVDKSVTTSHTPTAALTVGRATPIVVGPSTVYDPYKKHAPDFITSTDSAILSDEEKEFLELIVNFRLNDKVCFADILGNLNVEFSDKIDNDAIRHQSIDRTLLEKKLDELRKCIDELEAEIERLRNNENGYDKLDSYGALLRDMDSAAKKAEQRLQEAPGENVEFGVSRLGRFVPGDKPKVVIYYKNIENNIGTYESRRQVMAGVFVHEMFHAWNYFKAGKMSRSVMESRIKTIDEPMVEFETLYFLKELKAFTDSQSHPLKDKVSSVSLKTGRLVQNKQQSIGDVAAYGFGYYLFKELGKSDVESIEWIETYSKKSASIKNSNKEVKKVEDALIPVYPFMSEADVMKWFKEIIFDRYTTSVTAGKSASAKTGLDVSLRDLVLACIKTIGRKCFEAKELYAFAPIFEVCVAVPGNLEDALKQQLDELVNEGILDALPHDCYGMKLEDVEVKSKIPVPVPTPPTLVPAPTRSKKARSIPFAVEFPADKVIFNEKTAVKTFIESLKHIGLSKVQDLKIMMNNGYNLVSDDEDPRNIEDRLQNYVDKKYIYTKLGNQQKKGYLHEIANKLGISIKIYDI